MIIISKTTNNQQHNSVAFIHTLFCLLVDTISQVRVLTSENDGYDVNDVVNDDVIILESLDVLFLFIYC